MELGPEQTSAVSAEATANHGGDGSKRVCDRCISKKVKCDLQRPRCSRCQETASECIYSAVKRRPGPRKGWTRNSKRQLGSLPVRRTTTTQNHEPKLIRSAATGSDAGSAGRAATASNSTTTTTITTSVLQSPIEAKVHQWQNPAAATVEPSPLEQPSFQLTTEQTKALLNIYFSQDHHMIPLFNQHTFMQEYETGRAPPVLVHTVAAITAVIYAEPFTDRSNNPRAFLDALLRSASTTELEINFDISLQDFQVLCLLAHYDFHQRPGPRSWVRIGNLTRKAYRLGLNQLENPQHCALLDQPTRMNEKEEWRRLWWTIYCLDSYSNITAGTPLIVELSSLRTALPMCHDFQSSESKCQPMNPVFLSGDTADLWATMQALTSCGHPHEFDMHIIMGTLVNEAATCLRLVRQNPCKSLHNRIRAFEEHLNAARVALPADYLDPTRRTWASETDRQQHARLYNIVLLQSATIMLVLAKLIDAPSAEEALNWQHVLECCEAIVTAVKYWDGTKLTTADPAICFTFSGVLTLLHVCSKCSPAATLSAAAADLQASFDRQIRILKLYLEHFGTHWFLPRFLLASHDRLTRIISKPMQIWEAKRVIQGHQTMLQQRWLSTMSKVEQSTEDEKQELLDASAWFDQWPIEEWYSELMGNADMSLP